MKVFMIGGTGLLGSEAAKVLISRGHRVSSVALPPLPDGAVLPPEMEIRYGNYLEMSDDELRAHFAGCEGFVFAAGVDERVEGPAPIYDLYKKYNIDPINRLLKLAKECGVKHTAVCGSYFAYFAKTKPELKLTEWHPYIRSRVDQENAAISFADENFSVGVLELPYIFGTQPGRKPVWMFLAEQIKNSKGNVMYPKGGSAMVTVHQVGQAVAGALEHTCGGKCWPIGYYNMTWKQMIAVMCKYMGCPEKKVTTIPKWLFSLGCKSMLKQQQKRGIQGGLYMPKLADIQCSELFIDKSLGCEPLGVEPDDIDAAIGDSMRLCAAILDGKVKTIGMKGE
ncbi:NAD(P)-dependent oxidoreductase [Treponema socranskii]|uniref:NAD-dependent epimerase/dehydratase family protein n=1 Tax=Treponema socranskii TaxID=53419 RepID=UPI0028E895C5|nr:NAD(P)-dependent oxidoreductase [Treponema socranskii]